MTKGAFVGCGMARTAKVGSIQAIDDFRIAFCKMAEEVRVALDTMRTDIRRFVGWLETEQLQYWQAQIKSREKALAQAKADLNRKRLATSKQTSDCSAEIAAVRRAQRMVEEAHLKIKAIHKWSKLVEKAVRQYEGRGRQLGHCLTTDVPHAINLLEQMVTNLEAYTKLTAPTISRSAPAGPTNSQLPGPTNQQTAGASDRQTELSSQSSDPTPAPLEQPAGDTNEAATGKESE